MATTLTLCDGPYSWSVLLSESKQIYLLPIAVSLTEFFCNETSRTWASLVLKPGNMDFDQAQVPFGHNWVAEHSTESLPCGFESPTLDKQFQIQLSEMERWWPAQSNSVIDGKRSWRMGGKGSGKSMLRNPFHNLPEKLLNAWPVPTIFIGLILGTKEVKDRRTLTCLGNGYKGTEDSGAFGTHWGAAPARVPQLHPLPLACSQRVQGNKKQEIVKELRFC